MKCTSFFSVALVIVMLGAPMSAHAIESTQELQRSSAELHRAASSTGEVGRQWVVGTSTIATGEVIRTVENTVVVTVPTYEEPREGVVHEENYLLHTSAPMPVVLNKTGIGSDIAMIILSILMIAGGAVVGRRKF